MQYKTRALIEYEAKIRSYNIKLLTCYSWISRKQIVLANYND